MVMESVEMYIETWKTEPEFSKNILLTQSTVFRRVVKDLSIAITIAFSNSALKVSKFGIFLVPFRLDTEKYRPETSEYGHLFTQ